MKHWKGESCQMKAVFGSCPSRVLHICLGKATVPKTCGYIVPWVVEVVGSHCSHSGGVGPSVEVPGKDDDSILQASSPIPHSCTISLVIIWKKGRYTSSYTDALEQDLKANKNYLRKCISPWVESAPSFTARFKNLSAKD